MGHCNKCDGIIILSLVNMNENDVFFQSLTQTHSEKENPTAPIKSRT